MSVVGVSPVVTLFGWNPEELQSVAAFDLVHPADRARAAAALHRVSARIVRDEGAGRSEVRRVEAAVYKIVEEALTNVMRHAAARSVTMSISEGRR